MGNDRGSLIRATQYRYDHFLNLAWQEKTIPPLAPTKATETFSYDDVQRIRSASRSWVGPTGETPATDSYTYDDLGNVTSKSDYGTVYGYGSSARTTRNAGPHAVAQVTKVAAAGGGTATFSYDLNGNLTEGDGRTVDFDLMDRPVRVCSGSASACAPSSPMPGGAISEFSYAPDGARYRQVVSGAVEASFGPKTVYYVEKDYELTVWPPGAGRSVAVAEERSYVGGSVVVYRSGATREVRYQHMDRLGSLDAVTKDDASATELFVDAHGFDPWGKPRAREWTASESRLHPSGDEPSQAVTTDRGFTGHEHLDVHRLIHMNGRVYDYRLARFLSVDPIISDPANPQAVNPYSYIGNNPLSGTDPTGYMDEATGVTASNGCGQFAKCTVIMMNPSPATVRLYTPSNYSSGASGQTAQVAKANPAEVHNPQQVAQRDASKGKDDSLDGVLLAQAGGGRRGGSGPRPAGLPPENVEDIARANRANSALERIEGATGSRPAEIGPRSRSEEAVRHLERLAESVAPPVAGPVNPRTGLPIGVLPARPLTPEQQAIIDAARARTPEPRHGTFYVDPKGNVLPNAAWRHSDRFTRRALRASARCGREPYGGTNRRRPQARSPPRSPSAATAWSRARGHEPRRHTMAPNQPVVVGGLPMHFTWGDTVRVKVDAAAAARPGALAEVVGIREVENHDQSNQFWGAPLGTTIYLVEFGDGSAIEVPEGMLEADGTGPN